MNDFAIHEYLGILRFHIYNFLAGIKNNLVKNFVNLLFFRLARFICFS